MRISDWSSDVCSSDLLRLRRAIRSGDTIHVTSEIVELRPSQTRDDRGTALIRYAVVTDDGPEAVTFTSINLVYTRLGRDRRSEEPTSELQSLMRLSYAVFCLKKTTQ